MRQPKLGGQSPWGTIQDIYDEGFGCVFVSTPSHGGMYVPTELLPRIPQELQDYAASWSGSRHWYEEDECIAIPILYLGLNGNRALAKDTVNSINARLKKAA